MKLSQWLDSQRMLRVQFARNVGVHPITVTKWANGHMIPRPDLMAAIVAATDGAVQPNDFFAPPAPLSAAAA